MPHQTIGALALSEAIPGPLGRVLIFVGFVAGWGEKLFGPGHAFLAGTVAASVVTYFTFLFVLAGGSRVESTHGRLKFTTPLAGITAAVLGVFTYLAVFLAR